MNNPAPKPNTMPRADDDWYVEPPWCVELLLDAEPWPHRIWDPCCGGGITTRVLRRRGHEVYASDLVQRGAADRVQDFLKPARVDDDLAPWNPQAIITNPPFSQTEAFVDRGLAMGVQKMAVISPLKWLASRSRQPLFTERWPIARVYIMANRPSMPPGAYIDPETFTFTCDDPNPQPTRGPRWKAGDSPSGGSVDYAWFVFEPGWRGDPFLRWVSTPGRKSHARGGSRPAAEQALKAVA